MVFQERTYAVLIVSAGERFNSALMGLLPVTDFWPVTTVKSVAEARRRLAEQDYDLVLINAPLPDATGERLAVEICGDSDAGVLLFVKSDLYEQVYAKVTEYGVVTAPKPTSSAVAGQCIRALCAARERLRRLEAKQLSVEEKIQEIRLVNRAKWALIQCLKMTEQEAHRYLEKQAMDNRISRKEAARRVLATYQQSTGEP